MTELLYNQDAYLSHCQARVEAVIDDLEGRPGVVLEQTVFYVAGGGQPGDSGVLQWADGQQTTVVDTRKTEFNGQSGVIIHFCPPGALLPQPGDTVTATIDWTRRYQHMRMHTCLHLLCAVVDAPVTGGSIGAERSRLDFDVPEPILDKAQIDAALNQLIAANHAVGTRWISDAELDAQPELIKTMSVKPPRGSGQVRLLEIAGVDLQPCGGTHVCATGEIGPVRVAKIEKKSRLNRRVSVVFADS